MDTVTLILIVAVILAVAYKGITKYSKVAPIDLPHTLRSLEKEAGFSTLTQCEDTTCDECYPGRLEPATGYKQRPKIIQPSPMRPSRVISGHRAVIPYGVPDNAFAAVERDDRANVTYIVWKWVDQESGRTKALKSLAWTPEVDYYEVHTGNGKVVKTFSSCRDQAAHQLTGDCGCFHKYDNRGFIVNPTRITAERIYK